MLIEIQWRPALSPGIWIPRETQQTLGSRGKWTVYIWVWCAHTETVNQPGDHLLNPPQHLWVGSCPTDTTKWTLFGMCGSPKQTEALNKHLLALQKVQHSLQKVKAALWEGHLRYFSACTSTIWHALKNVTGIYHLIVWTLVFVINNCSEVPQN